MENPENKKDSNNEKTPEGEKEGEDEETKASERRKAEMKRRQDELMLRGEKRDFLRRLLVERNEAEQEETLIRAQEARELRCLQVEQTQKLGQELVRRKNDEIREQKLRQLLRKDSIELKKLENQLRETYEAKAAKTQLLERDILRESSRIREIEDDRVIQGWYQDDRFEKQLMLESRLKKERYRRDLQDQLASNHRLRQLKIEETRLERKLVEDALTLVNEDGKNRREKRERASRLLAEQTAFLEARDFRKSRENQAMLKEQEELARILADKMMRENQSKHVKSTIVAAKEAILEKMTEKMLNDERKKRQRENAINELIAEEEKNNLENRLREASLVKTRTAREMLEDMERQKKAREEIRAREAKIDREFAKYLEKEREKFVIDDRRKQDERRSKAIEYGKDLREAIADGSRRYARDILENQAALGRDRMIDEERRKSIEEERSRMLREHEIHLQGFFNSRV